MNVAILIAAVIAASNASVSVQPPETAAACYQAEWAEQSFSMRQGLPFDPLSFEAPTLGVDLRRINDGRWWAEGMVNVIVAVGWLAADRAAPATDLTESFIHRPELN